MNKKKVILVTGSEGTIGRTIVKRFAEESWEVIGIDVVAEDKIENKHLEYINCDVTNRELLSQKVNEIEGKGVEILALFTAASEDIKTSFEETDIESWQNLLNVRLGGTINACAAVAPHMAGRKFGKIVILTPNYKYVDGDCILNATAAGTLHGFAKCFGIEVASSNVMVNSLYPNLPMDCEKTADVAFYLANNDEYTTAQVISITGRE